MKNAGRANTLTKSKPPQLKQLKGVNNELLSWLDFITPDKPESISQLYLIIRFQGDSSDLGDALTARRRLQALQQQGARVAIILEATTGIAGLIVGSVASPSLCLMHQDTFVSLVGVRVDYKREYVKVPLQTLVQAVRADVESLESDLSEYDTLINQLIASDVLDTEATSTLFRKLFAQGCKINLSPIQVHDMGLVDHIFANEGELHALLTS